MAQKKSGRVLVVFLVITAILMGTLAAIAVFFFQLEIGERKAAEARIEEYTTLQADMQAKIDKLQKSLFLLEETNKEADDRINSLLDELDLQEGLRDEMKKEITGLKAKITTETEAKDKMRKQMAQLESDYETSITSLNSQLKQENDKYNELKEKYNALLNTSAKADTGVTKPAVKSAPVEGSVINVDDETQFVIVNIGSEEGLAVGQILSVYRESAMIGNIRITRVQKGMSAADPVKPLKIDSVKKSDRVVLQ